MEGRRETGEQPVRANQRVSLDWTTIKWDQIKHHVGRIQRQIFCATRAGDFFKVSRIQKLLAKSLPARLWAVKLVTEINSGRATPGIDGKCYSTPKEKIALAESLKLANYKPDPVRVVYIPKPNGELRRLGIPTMRDRAMQALVLLGMDSEWEARFEPHSFGFRPGRSAIDAAAHIWNTLMHAKNRTPHPGWVFDADISKCFDCIDHEALMKKIGANPFSGIIKAWLKAGAVSVSGFEKSERGTPQGGVISPLLANIALDGMERLFGALSKTNKYQCPSRRKGMDKDVAVFRYADDFIILGPSRYVLTSYVIPKVRGFLATVGLTLKEAKTRIVNVSEGFEFLGFRFQRFFRRDGSIKEFSYYPSRERMDRFLVKLKEYLQHQRSSDIKETIIAMNRRIRGFCNYFKWSDAHDAFAYLSHRLWEMMGFWTRRRHSTRNWKWLRARYWKTSGNSKWVFTHNGVCLVSPYTLTTQWWKWPKVRIMASPYDPALSVYWQSRMKRGTSWARNWSESNDLISYRVWTGDTKQPGERREDDSNGDMVT
nr:group II intron reverse transcriptase/maturase [Candidatus Sigynarchaeota archaeon]